MSKIKKIILVFLVASLVVYVGFKNATYSLEYETEKTKEEINNLETEIDDLQIKIVSESSRVTIQENNPNLTYNNNVYYLEEDKNE